MDPAFPFLISLGINNLFQGFRDKEFRFVGIIHLWWGWENNHEIQAKKFFKIEESQKLSNSRRIFMMEAK